MPNFKVYLLFFAIIICAVAGFFGYKEYKIHSAEIGYADAGFQASELRTIHVDYDYVAISVRPAVFQDNSFDLHDGQDIKTELSCIRKMKSAAIGYAASLQPKDIPLVVYRITYHFKNGAEKTIGHDVPALEGTPDLSALMATDEVKNQIDG